MDLWHERPYGPAWGWSRNAESSSLRWKRLRAYLSAVFLVSDARRAGAGGLERDAQQRADRLGVAVVLVLPSIGLLFTLVWRSLVEETPQPSPRADGADTPGATRSTG
jgi:hypothetical protein